MNSIILDTQFITYRHFPDEKLFIIDYKASTEKMTIDQYKDFVMELKDLTVKHVPRFLIDNSVNRFFIVAPDMQEWTVEQLGPAWIGFGLQKYVQILAKDLVANLSGQQTVEAAQKIPGMFETKFFENMQDAITWFGVEVDLET